MKRAVVLGAAILIVVALVARRWFVPILTKTTGTWVGTPRS